MANAPLVDFSFFFALTLRRLKIVTASSQALAEIDHMADHSVLFAAVIFTRSVHTGVESTAVVYVCVRTV